MAGNGAGTRQCTEERQVPKATLPEFRIIANERMQPQRSPRTPREADFCIFVTSGDLCGKHLSFLSPLIPELGRIAPEQVGDPRFPERDILDHPWRCRTLF